MYMFNKPILEDKMVKNLVVKFKNLTRDDILRMQEEVISYHSQVSQLILQIAIIFSVL